MRRAARILISVSISVLAIASAAPAPADSAHPPGVIRPPAPDRHETRGDVEIHVPRTVKFPPLYPDYGAMGIHHHGAGHRR